MRHHPFLIAATAGSLALAFACKRPAPSRGAQREQRQLEKASDEQKKPSDLDQPVEKLFAAVCEHGKKTFECDECRYEAGIVRAPETLFSCGLMKRVKAQRRGVETALALTGEVQFDERRVAHVSSQAEGIVQKVHVMLGDKVRRGQALVELESVAVGEAQGAYLESRAALALAERTFERQARLRKELISSEKEYLQAKQELDAAQIRASGAMGKLERLGMDGASIRTLTPHDVKGRLVLRAPTEGVVLAMHAVPGEVVKTEESVLTLGDNSVVWVWANVYEGDVADVKRAQSRQKLAAHVEVKAYPGQLFPATVDLVSPAMEESSRTVKARVEVTNPERLLLAGMFADVTVRIPEGEQAIAVPADALLEDEGRSFLFLRHHGDYYVRRPVTRGRAWEGWVEVTRGLSGGEAVVADGAFLMKSDVLRSKMGAGCAD